MVGIDVRSGPLDAMRQSPYPPDLLVNPLDQSADDAVQAIQDLRPEGYDYGRGVDGECLLHHLALFDFFPSVNTSITTLPLNVTSPYLSSIVV